MKSRGKIIFEGVCYTIVAAGTVWGEMLAKHLEKPPTQGALLLATVISLVAVANALKAYASSSTGDKEAIQAEVKAAVKEEKIVEAKEESFKPYKG